ncbi:MAG: serine/threonine-protein kinase, partial [Pseudomonadota bacterium]
MPTYCEGQVLAERFEIVGVLGRGGMTTVYLARDRVRGERVALKLLHEHLAQDPSMRERLRRELSIAARLHHPGALVPPELFDLGDAWALSLPFHPGETLEELVVRDGPLEPEAVRRLGVRLAEVLAEAHEVGVLHRDVTPRNVLVGPRGEPVLTDFGLARLRDGGSTRGTGMLGTPGYAAPEVYDGVRADPRSDLYALGAVLWLAATGRPAFEADSPMKALRRQLSGALPSLTEARPGLPADLCATIGALLQADPERRPQGARDVVEALQRRRAPVEAPAAESAPAALAPRPTAAIAPRLPEG